MGDPLTGLKFRLHGAEQEVWFRGEAVGGTVGEGVAGWGFRCCRGQRLKLAKFCVCKSWKTDSRFSQ